jgi:hypothetical protein
MVKIGSVVKNSEKSLIYWGQIILHYQTFTLFYVTNFEGTVSPKLKLIAIQVK